MTNPYFQRRKIGEYQTMHTICVHNVTCASALSNSQRNACIILQRTVPFVLFTYVFCCQRMAAPSCLVCFRSEACSLLFVFYAARAILFDRHWTRIVFFHLQCSRIRLFQKQSRGKISACRAGATAFDSPMIICACHFVDCFLIACVFFEFLAAHKFASINFIL